jgi:CelD/BcsL family acetyltransferase involved in cellulose biosynthesis
MTDEIKVITEIQEFDELAAHWHALGEQRWGPLTSHEWFAAAARHLCASSALHVVTVWRGGTLAAVAPLVRSRHRGFMCLELIGQRALYEPTSLPAVDQVALAALCSAIVDQQLPTVLQRLDVTDPCLSPLEAAASGRGLLRVTARPPTHYVDASAHKTHADTSGERRKRKKLEAQGFSTIIESPAVAELPSLLAAFFEVEASGWKGRRGSAVLARRGLRSFFTEVAERFARRNALVVARLSGPERNIAVRLCLEQDRRLWELKIGYDEAWAKYSPGTLLTTDTVNYAVDVRNCNYEFLGVAEDWQKPWATHVRQHCAAVFYPKSVVGMTVRALDNLATAARSIRAH